MKASREKTELTSDYSRVSLNRVCVNLLFSLVLAGGLISTAWAHKSQSECYITIDDEIDPVIVLLVVAYKEKGAKDELILDRILDAITNGCDLNVTDRDGLSPLNTAILFQHHDLVQLFIENGADPHLRIIGSRSTINGLDSLEFSKILMDKEWSYSRKRIYNFLKGKM